MRLLRLSVRLVLIGVAVTVAVWFWPANLGGRTTYVSTHGTSMIPRFHSGDLAIVQRTSDYHVGDITAYHSATLHTIVLHRIVAITDGHFTFKGDNNNFTDPDHPTVDQLVGRLVARVPHGGEIRGLLARPVVLFPVLAVVLGGFAFSAPRSRRNRARRARGGNPRPRDRRDAPRNMAVLVVGALATSGAALVAVTVWRLPRTETTTAAQPYRQTATIGYSGNAPRDAVYPDGHLDSGDPIFTRLINQFTVDVHSTFVMSPAIPRALHETSQVIADMSSDTGWHRDLVLAPSRTFPGDTAHATATLDLRVLHRIEQAFSAETGLATPDVTLQIVWTLHVSGAAAATPINVDLAPVFAFQVTPVELLPTPAPNGRPGAEASVSKTGSVAVRTERARTFDLWRIQLSDPFTRSLTIGFVAVILAASAAVAALDRRRRAQGAAAAIIARYRHLLVNADAIPLPGRRPVVAVDRTRDLVRLAKLHEEFIVHAEGSDGHRFAVFTDAVVYVHDVGSGAGSVSEPDDVATWALARLEACAAERRRAMHASAAPPSRPAVTHPHPAVPTGDGTLLPR
jgi:signal peptidase I